MIHTDIIGSPINYARAFGVNVVEDDCADDDTGDWTASGTGAALSDNVGEYKLISNGSACIAYIPGQTFFAGRIYQITFDIQWDGGGDAIRPYFYDGAAQYGNSITTTAAWVRISGVIICATSTINGRAGVETADASGGFFLFKNITCDDITDMVLPGTPLLVHDTTGASELPDGSEDLYKLSRPYDEIFSAFIASELGVFSEDTGCADASRDADNIVDLTANLGTNELALIFYETKARFMESESNTEVVSLGYVKAANNSNNASRGLTTNFLISKVPVSAVGPGRIDLSSPNISLRLATTGKLYTDGTHLLSHNAAVLGASNPAAKWLTYLSRESGVAYLYYLFKEMIYDGTWGDDDEFLVADDVNITTDDNANNILYGTKRVKLDKFIADKD